MTSGMNAHPPDDDDRQRLSDWMRQHGAAVRGYVGAWVRRPDQADDLTQEVFRRAWQARASYREQGTPRAYLLRIADRLVCDRQRRATSEVQMDAEGWKQIEPTCEVEPSRRLEQAEAAAQLTAALDRLSPPQQRVLLLRYYGQLDFAEIAAALNCPLNTALSHARRGLEALRGLLSGSESRGAK